ncbi:polyketide synthase dehydratase domain-containing protein [Streptomyces lydicus]|nr:polyketide synthase dehydratase domain-containing protein [Streptomyces lydicus]
MPGEPARHCWRADAGTDALPWLADHRVHGNTVLPGAAHCGMALAAACEVFGAAPHEVEVTDVHFEQLLRLDRHTELSTVVTMTAPDRAHCEILARGEDGGWERQADAVLHRLTVRPEARTRSVDALRMRHPLPLDPAEFYGSLRRRGLEHGPAFTGITELRSVRHHDSYVAGVALPPAASDPAPGLPVHPVLLDLCAQLAVAPLMHEDDQALVLPVGMQAVRVLGDPATAAYGHAHISENARDAVVANVRLLDEGGTVVLAAHGIRFVRRAVRDTRPPTTGCWRSAGSGRPGPPRTAAAHRELAARGRGGRRRPGAGRRAAHPLRPYERLGPAAGRHRSRHLPRHPHRAARRRPRTAARRGAGVREPGRRGAGRAVLRRTRRLLGAVQAVTGTTAAPRLCVVTRGARNVEPGDTVDVGQSALRGLVRVAALEHPELRPALIDADPRHADPTEVALELLADADDDEVALRAGGRWVARLRPAPQAAPRAGPPRPAPCGTAWTASGCAPAGWATCRAWSTRSPGGGRPGRARSRCGSPPPA